jgi:hypothetical protein
MNFSPDYIAGYFDGEGSIGIYQTRGSRDSRYKSGFKTPSWVRSVNIVNTYTPVLKWCQKTFGGRLNQIVKDKKYKPCYQWSLGAKADIQRFLEFIYPHLREKRVQALVMLYEVKGTKDTWLAAQQLKNLKEIIHAA